MECYQHSGTAAVESCVVCERPFCEACRETVAEHAMCRPCVEAEQARLQGETPAVDPAAAPLATEPAVTAVPPKPCGFVQYVKAVLFAGVAAVLGALIWDKFVLWTGIQLGLIAVAVGWVVAVALCMGADGRPGKLLPWLGALMAAFGIMLGNGLLYLDMAARHRPDAIRELQNLPYFFQVMFFTLNAPFVLDLMDWVFVAIGVWEGWSIPRNMNRRVEAGPAAGEESPATA